MAFYIRIGMLALAAFSLPMARASTFWNGPNVTFTQGQDGASDAMVPGVVEINRGGNSYIYNSATEGGPGIGSPADTTWAMGSPDMIGNLSSASLVGLTFVPFAGTSPSVRSTAQGPPWFSINPYIMTGNGTGGPITFVVHLVQEDIYMTLTFNAWGQHFAGGFSYTRSTASAAPPPPPTPTVNITTPTNNSVFAAPANVSITANASVSAGSVTNVQFLANANSVGSASGPFNITANGLGSGSYALTAVATAGGISATSAPVNISVVTPVNTAVSGATATATVDNKFTFSFSTTPGLRYEVDISSNLFNWTPVSTNVATGNPSFFTNPISGDGNYYRVGRLPNP